MDNDVYGHVNNVTYYSYFDTVANQYLIDEGGMTIGEDDVVGFVVASNCEYKSPLAHPVNIDAGFCVNRIGNSSVEYAIGIFEEGADSAAAYGTFTHVFVDRRSDRPAAIPAKIRTALEKAIAKQT